jgi:hypothetical protein
MADINISQELSEDDIDEIIPGADVTLYESGTLKTRAVSCTKNLPDSISYDFTRTLAKYNLVENGS